MELIGNTGNIIDWDKVIQEIPNKKGHVLRYNDYTFTPQLGGFSDLNRLWQEAGYAYDDPAIEWTNYFPDEGYDVNIMETFRQIVDTNMLPFMVWISKIKPGRMAPWHFDAHSKIEQVLSLGKPVRYVCYIEKPTDGHISIVGNHCIYKPEQGSIYRWDSYDDWHCGMNGGMTDKFLFNYWGYLPHGQNEG